MNVNVTQLTIKADEKFLSFHPVNQEMEIERKAECKRLQEKYGPECFTNDKASPRWLVLHNGAESDHAIECLLGKASFYPYFADGIHHIMFGADGIREYCTSERPPNNENWFTFPGAELVPYIRQALWRAEHNPPDDHATAGSRKAVVVVPPDVLISWRIKYGPKYEWDMVRPYRDDQISVADKVKQDLVTNPELQDNLDSLVRIAKNHSDGEPSTIRLSFDMTPQDNTPGSYYFVVTSGRTGNRVINGGIIAHPERDGDTITGYHYSTHT